MAVEELLEQGESAGEQCATLKSGKQLCDDSKATRGACLAARHWVVTLLFFSRVSQSVLRMAMGALVIPLCEDMQCGAGAKGWLLSAHAAGYCSTQVLGGHVADRLGGKSVVSCALGLSGLAVAATPAAASAFGLQGIAACQAAMGVAMGPLFPASVQLLARWLPAEERAVASTALDSGITLGSLIVVPLSGVLAVSVGWKFAFTLYGLGMMAYTLVWAWLATDSPADCAYCSAEELAFLQSSLPRSKNKQKDPDALVGQWTCLECFSYARLWAIYGSHFTFNYATYFVTSWSATYYLETFGLRPEQAGLHLSMPHLANSLVKVLVNPTLERKMKDWGAGTLQCRRIFSVLGFLGLAAFLGLVPSVASPTAATVFFSVAFSFLALHPSGFKANYMDVTTSRGGLVSGIGNTVGSAGSTVGPLVVAQLRDATGDWAAAFQSVALLNVASAFLFLTMSSTVPIEADGADRGGQGFLLDEDVQKKK
jgi:sugar phosphate permease